MAGNKEWMALSGPTTAWDQAVQDYFGGQAPDIGLFPDIASLRKWITESKAKMAAEMAPSIPGVKQQDHQVSMRDGAKITCRVYSPESPPAGGSPLMVIYHGGGWCIGGLENEEMLCRMCTSKFGVTAVNVDYRLAPEHPFPTGTNDCYDATKWAAANASSLGANPTKGFLIGGTSAGGNMSDVVAHLARDDKISPPLTGVLYMIPAFVDSAFIPEKYKDEHQSQEQNKNASILGRAAIDLFRDNYFPDKSKRNDPLFSSFLWPSGHAGLPPSAFQVCGADPLRDDALIFERILREEHGTKTKLLVYPGMPHGFWSICPKMKESAQFVHDSQDCVKWLLEQSA